MTSERQRRLVSLDAFRGITIASMILVNNPGSAAVYGQLEHASWHGWTFTDTVFPFFLWIVGVSITLSTAKRLEAGADPRKMLLHIIRRAMLLYFIGFFLAGFPNFSFAHIRYLGVLQRIAICYFISAITFLFTTWRTQVAVIIGLCATYWLLMTQYPVPGVGKGQLGPEGNFARYIDGLLLSGHMWAATKYWDPEGIVSTLPAIATTLLGILAGHLLRKRLEVEQRVKSLFWFGLGLVVLGLVCNIWLPINKNLWTVSFTCFMAGLATLEFLVLYWLIDIKNWRRWFTPFVIYGMNAIAAFVLSGMIGRLLGLIHVRDASGGTVSLHTYVVERAFAPFASPMNASLLFAVANVLLVFACVFFLYKRRWFLRI